MIPSVLVTGAGRGIGAAVAHRVALSGSPVVCVDIDGDTAEETARAIRADGGAATAVRADVSSAQECAAVVDRLPADAAIGGLCNVAGLAPYRTSVERTPEEVWDRVMAVNVKSVYLLSRACLPRMRNLEGGATIVNTASVHAYASHGETAPYAASKGAIVSLTRQMAIDLAPAAIRVVAVAPGAVDTPMSHAGADAVGRTLAELGFPSDRDALGRLGSAAEVAEVFAWLLSPAAGFVNGATVVADGGLLTRLPGAST